VNIMALTSFFNESDLIKRLQQQIEKPGAKENIGGGIGFFISPAFLFGFAYKPLVHAIATADPTALTPEIKFAAFFVLAMATVIFGAVGAVIGRLFEAEEAPANQTVP
jgi:hypothetical protein